MNRRYRKTIIAGNWKMNKTAGETKKFAEELKAMMPKAKWCDVVVCVPSCNIPAAMKAFKDVRAVWVRRMCSMRSPAPTPARYPPIC